MVGSYLRFVTSVCHAVSGIGRAGGGAITRVKKKFSALLGDSMQLEAVDERLEQLGLNNPQDLDPIMAAVLGAPKDVAYLNWHDHFRTWRKNRIALLARECGDQLDDLAEVLSDFAAKVKAYGPEGYLQSMAHRGGETPFVPPAEPEA